MKNGVYHEVKSILQYDDQEDTLDRGGVAIATNG